MPQTTFSGSQPKRIVEAIKKEYQPLRLARRGNVIWMVCNFHNGFLEIVAFLMKKSFNGMWTASRFRPRDFPYVTCPSSYLDMCQNPCDPKLSTYQWEESWRSQVRKYHKERGQVTSSGMSWKNRLKVGDVVALPYRDLTEGMVIQVSPLKIEGRDKQVYITIPYHKIQGWISKATREEDAEESANRGS